MAGVTRSEFTELMVQDMYDWILQDYTELSPVYQQVYKEVPSSAAYEKFTTAVGLGDMLEKPEGEDLRADVPLEAYTVVCKNRTFGRQTRMTKEMVEDAQKVSNILRTTVGTWGESVVRSKDRWYAKLLYEGAVTAGDGIYNNTIPGVVDDATGVKIYDSQTLFGSAHPDKVGNTYSNTAGSTSLTHTNLKTYYDTYITTNAKDERGNEIENTPNTLLITPDNLFTARVILANTAIPGSVDNDINVLASIVNILVWPRLSGTNLWALCQLGVGNMATNRQGPEIDFYQDETSKDYFATINMRWGGCWTDWRPWLGANFSTT